MAVCTWTSSKLPAFIKWSVSVYSRPAQLGERITLIKLKIIAGHKGIAGVPVSCLVAGRLAAAMDLASSGRLLSRSARIMAADSSWHQQSVAILN